MYISQLVIKNFRGIKSGKFNLLEHSVLLGANNSGKSSVMDAIGYLLGRDRMIRNLGDYDFFGGTPAPHDRIHISGVITGFPTNDPSHYPEWFNTLSGGVPVWYDAEKQEVNLEADESGKFMLATQIAFCARFDEEDLDYESVRYFVDADTDPFEDSVVRLNSNHLKDLGFFLIPSKRNWERTISFGSELFKKVIRFQDAIPANTVLKTRESLRSISDRIENEEPFKSIVERINKELKGFINLGKDGLNFIPTSGDVEGVLQSLTPHLHGIGNINIPLGNHGSGLISLQTLLLLMEFGRYRHEKGSNFIIGAEEPELHLQPGLHRRLVGRIRGVSNQSILTTHSPQIASYFRPNEICIIRNVDGELRVIPLLGPNESIPAKNALMRLYTIYRAEICEALMNKAVLLPEGITEYHWIKSLINTLITAEGWTGLFDDSTSSQIGILPTQDSNIENTYSAFHNLIDTIIPLVDGDSAGNEYVKKLSKTLRPPQRILQLPINWDLEKIIAWIVGDSDDSIPAGLRKSLSPHTSLHQALTANKSNWDIHEKVVQLISEKSECLDRAKRFVNSLCSVSLVAEGDNGWVVDSARSTTVTSVLVFDPK